MKKTILILIILFTLSVGFSQGGYNLEFSQAILVENGNTMTVPSGKVWKAISAQTNLMSSAYKQIIINGNSTYIYYLAEPTYFPIWLPAGTSIEAGNNTKFISVVEFNLISN